MQLAVPFGKLFRFLSFARECIYYESYVLEQRRGSKSLVLPALLVGGFDSPLLFAIALTLDSALFSGEVMRPAFPSSIASIFSLAWVLVVACLELLYYRATGRDRMIVRGFERRSDEERAVVRRIAVIYAIIAFVGGSGLIYLIW